MTTFKKTARHSILGGLAVLGVALAGAASAAAAPATMPVAGDSDTSASASGADVKQLSFHSVVHVKKSGAYTERDTQVIEALTPTGAQSINPYQQQFSSDLSTLKVVSAWIQTAGGKHVDIPKSDIFVRPVPAAEGAPMFSHGKVLNVVLPHFNQGDKLHIETLLNQSTPYFPNQYFDVWGVDEDQAALDQKIVVHAPAAMHLHAAQRGGWQLAEHSDNGQDTFTATLARHKARFSAPGSVSADDYSPLYEVTSFPTWAAVGQAYWKRAQKPAEVTPKVKQLANKIVGNKTGLAAVKALYAWDSSHIRYVGLELGVGGFVPISATQTIETGYGDCKAHSTLLESLLAAENITAYPVLINWDDAFKLVPLPGPAFNHAIDYLPKYHLFLDATGQTETPGQLAVGERDKPVVIAGPHPRLTVTPGGQPAQNKLVYNARLQLHRNGTLTGQAHMRTSGWWAWYNRMIFSEVPPGAYGRLMNQLLSDSGGGQGSFSHSDPQALDKAFVVKAHWKTPAFAIPGKTLTFTLDPGPYLIPGENTSSPLAALASIAGPDDRQHGVSTYVGQIDWHTTMQLPSGYKAQYLPPSVHLKNKAGSFKFSVTQNGNQVKATYRLSLSHVHYAPAQYAELRKLIRTDLRYLNTPLVFSQDKQGAA